MGELDVASALERVLTAWDCTRVAYESPLAMPPELRSWSKEGIQFLREHLGAGTHEGPHTLLPDTLRNLAEHGMVASSMLARYDQQRADEFDPDVFLATLPFTRGYPRERLRSLPRRLPSSLLALREEFPQGVDFEILWSGKHIGLYDGLDLERLQDYVLALQCPDGSITYRHIQPSALADSHLQRIIDSRKDDLPLDQVSFVLDISFEEWNGFSGVRDDILSVVGMFRPGEPRHLEHLLQQDKPLLRDGETGIYWTLGPLGYTDFFVRGWHGRPIINIEGRRGQLDVIPAVSDVLRDSLGTIGIGFWEERLLYNEREKKERLAQARAYHAEHFDRLRAELLGGAAAPVLAFTLANNFTRFGSLEAGPCDDCGHLRLWADYKIPDSPHADGRAITGGWYVHRLIFHPEEFTDMLSELEGVVSLVEHTQPTPIPVFTDKLLYGSVVHAISLYARMEHEHLPDVYTQSKRHQDEIVLLEEEIQACLTDVHGRLSQLELSIPEHLGPHRFFCQQAQMVLIYREHAPDRLPFQDDFPPENILITRI